jgi:hypothetical protein
VLAGGEVLAGDDLVLRDLPDLRCPRVGDVHQNQRRSTAGGEGWRRPCQGVVVPGEGLENMGKQGAHEHRGSAGMLSPNLILLEIRRRVVLDDGVDVGFLPAAMATGVLRVRVTEGGEEGAGSLQGDDVVLLTPWVGMERLCTGWSAEGRAAAEEGARRSYGEWCWHAGYRNWRG